MSPDNFAGFTFVLLFLGLGFMVIALMIFDNESSKFKGWLIAGFVVFLIFIHDKVSQVVF